MGSEGVEDLIRHTFTTSHDGCLEAGNTSRGTHEIALDGEDRLDGPHGRLIITHDGIAKEEQISTG